MQKQIINYLYFLDCIKQKSELSLLSGYIKLFGKNHLTQVLNSHAHLDRLVTVLIEILELDYKTIILLEETSIRGNKTCFLKKKKLNIEESILTFKHVHRASGIKKLILIFWY